MGSLITPPGHPGHELILLVAKVCDVKITVAPPDDDLHVRF